MEKSLWVLRHATAEYGSYSLPDFDRSLTPQGEQEAKRVGAHLASQGVLIDAVIASPARRTTQTTEALLDALALDATLVTWDKNIYEASVQTLCNIVVSISENVDNVLLVGHNPGLEILIGEAVGQIAGQSVFLRPASCVNVLFPSSWGDMMAGSGRISDVFHVADL